MSAPAARKSDAPANAPTARKTDKDLPLIQDIRLLGRILGDAIRDQEGVAAFKEKRAPVYTGR